MFRRLLFLAALLLAAHPGRAEPVRVVATFTILAEMVAEVGGAEVAVVTLVGPDGDSHMFAPSPADARAVAAARLVVANGLGFEPWLGRLLKASGSTARVVEASAGADLLPHDPHAWQDLANGRRYVANIAAALAAAAPDRAERFRANAEAYSRRLAELDAWVRRQVATVPEGKRRIITGHDAFAYFGRAYGIGLLAPQGLSTDAEPTPKDLAKLARQIKAEGVRAVFLENMADPRLMQALARDTGAVVGGTLYADALSAGNGPAPTYEAMFRHNVARLVAAMNAN